MRPAADLVGNILRDGTIIHENVRALTDDAGRVAVFVGRKPPANVYASGEVTYSVSRKPCSCKGDAPKMILWRLWEQSERQAAHAG